MENLWRINCKKSILIIHKYTSYIYTYIHKCLANKSTNIDHLFICMYVERPRKELLNWKQETEIRKSAKSEEEKEKRVGDKQMLNETI